MSGVGFHSPDDLERSFLQVVTLGYPELQEQVTCCEVDDYDPDGYCDVRVLSGPRAPIKDSCNGPTLLNQTGLPSVETILWINHKGFLDSVEFIGLRRSLDEIYQRFVDGASSSKLSYKYPGAN